MRIINSFSYLLQHVKVLLCFVVLLLVGCTGPSTGVAPIDERPQPPSQSLRVHLVNGGDTLYSIAFRYERDFRELAQINGLSNDYLIHPGQPIYLTAEAARSAGIQSASNTTRSALPQREPVPQNRTPESQTPQTTSVAVSVDQAPPVSPQILPALEPVDANDWVWPQSGPIVRSFGSGDPASKGIQISADEGSPVLAAIEGLVVYAGAGLRGYGNLLIVKHDEEHLSAYAYNQELLAQEGDMVRAGQQIATVGTDAEGNNRLYFEIRRDGTPVDPIRYLPRR